MPPNSYTVEKKLSVLAWHRTNGANLHATSRHFSINRKRIREWISKENELLQNNYGQARRKRKLGLGRSSLSEELDDSLFEFLETERSAGHAVSNKMLQQEAVRIAEDLGLQDFKASDMFLCRWKKRLNVTMRIATNESQKAPEELKEEISTFLQCVKVCRVKKDLTLYNIGNMDQTMVRFDCPPSRTNNVRGESSIRIVNTGCKKRGFTVALCARASGHKMPAFIVFKEPSGKIPAKVYSTLQMPENVKVTATKNGWMNMEKLCSWISRIWGPDEDDVSRLLILDKAPIHTKPEARAALKNVNTELIIIPGGLTNILQPADVCWNKPFKGHLTTRWMEYMQLGLKTPKGNLKRPSRQDVINWVSFAWSKVSEDIIETSFKRCGISNALNGSENGEFHEKLAEAVQLSSANLNDELLELLRDDDEESFDGFSSSDED